jgi:hypothetical protein
VLAGPVAELTGRLSGVSRRHTGAVIVLMAGAVLRIVMIVAYPPALWFQGDSGACIRRAQQWPQMGNRWPYLWLLMFLEPTGTFYSVELVRHLAGLSLAAAGYAFLRRVGVGAWVAAAAIAPMTLDARQLTLEQFILTETLLTTLLGVAALLVVWRNRPGWDACALAGVAVAIGWATRPSGIFAVAVLLLFLQIRWTGWRQPVAYLVNGTAIVGAVVSGGRGQLPGRHGHRRQVHLRPDGALRRLRDPADASSGPGSVPAAAARPAARARPLVHLEPEQPDPQRHGNQALLREFAIDVITQQPGAYAGRRQGDRARYFGPQASVDLPPTTASRVLHAYGQIVVRPPWAMSLAVLLSMVGGPWPRPPGLSPGRDRPDVPRDGGRSHRAVRGDVDVRRPLRSARLGLYSGRGRAGMAPAANPPDLAQVSAHTGWRVDAAEPPAQHACADPMCSMSRDPRQEECTICTAVAPDAV